MLTVNTNAKAVAKALEEIPAKQIPFARSLIANRMAQKVRANELATMKARLDRPTPWTLNSLYIRAATKTRPEARVWFKDTGPKSAQADGYLQPEVFAGDRAQKRSERALIAMGLITRDQFLVPASGAKLDAYGNMSRGQVRQVLTALRAKQTAGAAKRKGSRAPRADYFFGTIEGEAGVWERIRSAFGEGLRPILLVTTGSPHYRKQFPFFDVATNTVAANYEKVGIAALNEAMSTARP